MKHELSLGVFVNVSANFLYPTGHSMTMYVGLAALRSVTAHVRVPGTPRSPATLVSIVLRGYRDTEDNIYRENTLRRNDVLSTG